MLIVWTGSILSDWHNAMNWNPQQEPTSTNTAAINTGTVRGPPIRSSLRSPSMAAQLSGPALVRANRVMNGNSGFLAASGSLTVESNGVVSLQTAGEKNLDWPDDHTGSVLWTGGTFKSGTTIRNSGPRGQSRFVADARRPRPSQWFPSTFESLTTAVCSARARLRDQHYSVCLSKTNSGWWRSRSGTLRFDRGAQLDGMFITASGAAVQFRPGKILRTGR